MNKEMIFNFTVDKENLAVKVERSFDAPLDLVWSAWTEAEFLDQWWGPKPWRVETKSMDFSEGGTWLYAMVGPQGEKHWALKTFLKIAPRKSFTARNLFCDENGKVDPATTGSTWINSFVENQGTTLVTNDIRCDTLAHLEAHLKMGFKEGFTMGLGNLEELLARLQKREMNHEKTDRHHPTLPRRRHAGPRGSGRRSPGRLLPWRLGHALRRRCRTPGPG